jgi:hypothetical protein
MSEHRTGDVGGAHALLGEGELPAHLAHGESAADARRGARELVIARDLNRVGPRERIDEMELQPGRTLDRDGARESARPVHQRRFAQEANAVRAARVDVAIDHQHRGLAAQVFDDRCRGIHPAAEDRGALGADLHARALEAIRALHRVDRGPVGVVLQASVAHVAFDQEAPILAAGKGKLIEIALQLEAHGAAAASLDRAVEPRARGRQPLGKVVSGARQLGARKASLDVDEPGDFSGDAGSECHDPAS